MADFSFNIDFNWKDAAASSKAFFDQIEGQIKRIQRAGSSGRITPQQQLGQYQELQQKIRGFSPQVADPGQQRLIQILRNQGARLLGQPDPKAISFLQQEQMQGNAKRLLAQSSDKELIAARAEEAAASRRRAAAENRATNELILGQKGPLGVGGGIVRDEAKARLDNDRIRALAESQRAKLLAEPATRQQFVDDQAKAANLRYREAAEIRARAAYQAVTVSRETVEAEAEALVNTRLKAAEVKRQAVLLLRQRAAQGDQAALGALSGSPFQRLQAGIASRSTGTIRLPSEFQTGTQFLTSKALTTAGFAASGAIFYGLATAVHTSFEETKNLQKQFAILRQTLTQLGKGAEFDTITNGLFRISRETGIATSDLAVLAIQLRAAFSGRSAEFVNQQVEAAAQIERITGLTTTETTDSLTAISKSFGVSFRQIGDTAIGLQQRFGVLSKEIITFTADLAPVAEQAGISFRKLASIGAAVQQVSGRSGTGLAESLGRVFSGIQENAGSIVNIYQSNAKLAGKQNEIASALAGGQTGKVLEALIKDYDKLTKAQQNLLNSALGGSRQAPVLTALFGNNTLKQELARLNRGYSDAGKLSAQFKELQGTIGQALDQLKQTLIQIGVALGQAGVVPILQELVSVLQTIGGVIAPVLRFFGELNEATGNLVPKILALYTAFKLLSLVGKAGIFKGGAGAVATGFTGQAVGGGLRGALGGGAPVAAGTATGFLGAVRGGYSASGTTGAAKAGLAAALPQTVAGGLALGAVTSYLLVDALSSGYEQGVEKAIARARNNAKKNALTQKGLKLAQAASEPTFTSDIHGFGEAATNVKNLFTGGAGKTELVQDEYQKAVGAAFTAQIKAITNLKGFKNPQELIKKAVPGSHGLIPSREGFTNETLNAADPTDDVTFAALKQVHDALVKKYGKEYIDGVLKAARRQTRNKRIKAGDVASDDALLQGKRANFESGQITSTDLIKNYDKVISGLQEIVQTGGATSNQINMYLKTRSEKSKLISDLIKQDAENQIQINQATGADSSAANLQIYLATLRNPDFTDRASRAEVVGKILQEYDNILQLRIDQVSTAAEKLAIAQEGIKFDPEVRLELIKTQVDNALQRTKALSVLNKAAVSSGSDLSELETQIASFAQFLGLTINQAIQAFLNARFAEAAQIYAAMVQAATLGGKITKAARKQINDFKTYVGQLYGAAISFSEEAGADTQAAGDTFTADASQQAQLQQQAADEAAQQAKDAAQAARDLANAQANLMKAMAGNDPVAAARAEIYSAQVEIANAETQADQLNAQAHLIQAQHQLQDAINDIASAQADLLAAWVEADPLKAAQIALVKANQEAATAEGEAAQLRAQAAIVQAQHAIQKAMFDIINSETELLISIANAAGDTVGAASLALKEARDKLIQAQQSHAGGAELNSLQAQVYSAQAALRDAQLRQQEETIDFNLQTERISNAQAIAQYEALLRSADILGLTEQETRDLILKIQSLKKSLSQDLQFDLPTDLRLPTLYEARRLSQTGGNYQDNRSIVISLQSTDPASTEAAVSQITDAVNAPPVFGASGRIY